MVVGGDSVRESKRWEGVEEVGGSRRGGRESKRWEGVEEG